VPTVTTTLSNDASSSTPAADLDARIAAHLETAFTDPTVVRKLSQQYRREGYVKLRALVPEDLFAEVTTEVHRLLDLHAKRIDIRLKETGDSPRFMSTVGQRAIAQDSELIPAIYRSPAIMSFLSRIAGEPVKQCPWDEEKFIIIRQEKVGDTHGWHWGDFSFTVIWIIEAPEPEVGGMLQAVPHTDWDKDDPRVLEYLQDNPIRTYANATGDLYFLRSNTTLHRTIPLSEDRTRIILNTCWASTQEEAKPATHETMEAMFD
jgi:hypothetical protein